MINEHFVLRDNLSTIELSDFEDSDERPESLEEEKSYLFVYCFDLILFKTISKIKRSKYLLKKKYLHRLIEIYTPPPEKII